MIMNFGDETMWKENTVVPCKIIFIISPYENKVTGKFRGSLTI
jgi:hypothetical protein